jgi:predicted phage terminase large subunit-like protein
MFLGAMKAELTENQDLIDLFGLRKNEKNEVALIKDTETDVIVAFDDGSLFRVVAKGAEQKLRGLLWNGTRPDLVLIDDLENDELVMNRDRRIKLKRWFKGALMPAKSPRGKVRYWGTILHMDSVLEELMPNEFDKWTVRDGLKYYSTYPRRTLWKSVKYMAHNEDMTEFLWPDRYDRDYFLLLREKYAADGMLDLYSTEYLNKPIDDSVAYFKRTDLAGYSPDERLRMENNPPRLTYYAAVDLAIDEKSRADYSVFLVAGVDESKLIHVKHVIRERMDAREIVDTLIALQRSYDLQAIGIEEMQVSKAIGPFLREEMLKTGVFLNIIPMKHGGKDKVQRARSIQARMRIKGVRFDHSADWYPVFEDEVLSFPRGKKDDQVDALAYLGLMLDNMVEAQTDAEIEEEIYADELRKTGATYDGRSAITGY